MLVQGPLRAQAARDGSTKPIATQSPAARCPGHSLAPVQGVATHFGFKDAKMGNMAFIAHTGFNSIRDEVFWRHVEDAQGQLRIPAAADRYVNAALAAGLEPLLVLGYGHDRYDQGDKPLSAPARKAWIRYATFVVAHFKGRVHSFELWNEWDHTLGKTRPGRAEDYVRLVQEAAPTLRQINPTICLIAGAATSAALSNGWLDRALMLGLLQHVDALSIHSYNFTAKSPKARTPEAWHAQTSTWANKLEHASTMVKQKPSRATTINDTANPQAIRDKPLYVTEMGWPNHYGRFGISESMQAAYAARTFILARSIPNLHGLWWYGWQDKGRNYLESEHRYGITDPAQEYKMTGKLLAEQLRWLENSRFIGHLPLSTRHKRLPSEAYRALRFRRGDAHTSNAPAPATRSPHISAHPGAEETLALWSTESPGWTSPTAQIVLRASKTSRAESARFSTGCQVRKMPQTAGVNTSSWLLHLSPTPCLATIQGAWL